ncbi:MAG: 5'-nucleotidase C-terminal domain-containing protein [Alphaproteobacteria bacterium]|nr:5'-nucleotidase C-terminal domain-containing protein [Alphaproteobacteria bacterium]
MAGYTLQILHAGDFETDAGSMARAPALAAIVDALDGDPGTLILSAGGHFAPGPFLSAGRDPAAGAALTAFYDARYGLPADIDGDGVPDSFAGLEPGAARLDVALMNAIGVQASALGNQEFDLGTGVLAEAIGGSVAGPSPAGVASLGAAFPYLAANLDVSRDPVLQALTTDSIRDVRDFVPSPSDFDGAADGAKIASAAVATVNGARIGIVGAITPDLAVVSSPGDTTVLPSSDPAALAAILQPVVDGLLGQGIDKIVLLSHLRDLAATEALVPLLSGVDVVIAGGMEAPSPEAYPIVTANADGDPALIIATAGAHAELGRLVVEFDEAGRVVAPGAASQVYAVSDETVAALWGDRDPYAEGSKGALVADLVDAARSVIVEKDGNLFGRTDVFLEAGDDVIRRQETNLGDLSADADLARARAVDATVQVAIKNAGGIREPIGTIVRHADGTVELLPPAADALAGKEAGEVSQLDIENALRFNNGLTLLTVTRAQLVQAIEHGLMADDRGQNSGQFPQVSGVAFSFDPARPAGERVVSAALVADGHVTDVLVRDGALVGAADAPVRLVTINFLAGGGDGYPFHELAHADPDFTDRVDLLGEDANGDGVLDPGEDLNGNGALDAAPAIAPGAATFAAAGTEQDALADHLAARYGTIPYAAAETGPEGDARIQNLAARDDGVLDGPYALTGTAAGDLLEGGDGADTLAGESGDDTIRGAAGDDLILGGGGFDQMAGGAGGDFVLGGDAPDVIDGGDGDDRLLAGNEGTDVVRGGDGDDRLFGGRDGDTLDGGAGADTVSGDRGDDLLRGGDGSDVFLFARGQGRDVIADYRPGEDFIIAEGSEAEISDDGAGNAVIALAAGQQVLLPGVPASLVDLILLAT